jgi:hypothetical protein
VTDMNRSPVVGWTYQREPVALSVSACTGSRLVAVVVAGLPIAPLTSLAGLHLDRWVTPGRLGEIFGVITSVLLVATGAGQAVAALLLEPLNPEGLVALAAVPAGGAALLIIARIVSRRRPSHP